MSFRSSGSQMFLKIGVLKNFAIFAEKQLCWSLFLITLQACNVTKKRLQHSCFSVSIANFFTMQILRAPPVAAFSVFTKPEQSYITIRPFWLYHLFFNVLIQNIWLKTKNAETRERRKASIRTEIVKNEDPHTPALKK